MVHCFESETSLTRTQAGSNLFSDIGCSHKEANCNIMQEAESVKCCIIMSPSSYEYSGQEWVSVCIKTPCALPKPFSAGPNGVKHPETQFQTTLSAREGIYKVLREAHRKTENQPHEPAEPPPAWLLQKYHGKKRLLPQNKFKARPHTRSGTEDVHLCSI